MRRIIVVRPAWMITMIPLLVACRLAQPQLGLGGALLLGWALFLPGFALLCRYRGQAAAEEEEAGPAEAPSRPE